MKIVWFIAAILVSCLGFWFTSEAWESMSISFELKMFVIAASTALSAGCLLLGISRTFIQRSQKLALAAVVVIPSIILLSGVLMHISARSGADIGGLLTMFWGGMLFALAILIVVPFALIAGRKNSTTGQNEFINR